MTKRVTIEISEGIEIIRDQMENDHGIRMTYAQLINYLINFYMKHANEPRTHWQPLRSKQ